MSGAVGDKHELIRFWSQKVRRQGHCDWDQLWSEIIKL